METAHAVVCDGGLLVVKWHVFLGFVSEPVGERRCFDLVTGEVWMERTLGQRPLRSFLAVSTASISAVVWRLVGLGILVRIVGLVMTVCVELLRSPSKDETVVDASWWSCGRRPRI